MSSGRRAEDDECVRTGCDAKTGVAKFVLPRWAARSSVGLGGFRLERCPTASVAVLDGEPSSPAARLVAGFLRREEFEDGFCVGGGPRRLSRLAFVVKCGDANDVERVKIRFSSTASVAPRPCVVPNRYGRLVARPTGRARADNETVLEMIDAATLKAVAAAAPPPSSTVKRFCGDGRGAWSSPDKGTLKKWSGRVRDASEPAQTASVVDTLFQWKQFVEGSVLARAAVTAAPGRPFTAEEAATHEANERCAAVTLDLDLPVRKGGCVHVCREHGDLVLGARAQTSGAEAPLVEPLAVMRCPVDSPASVPLGKGAKQGERATVTVAIIPTFCADVCCLVNGGDLAALRPARHQSAFDAMMSSGWWDGSDD